MKLTRALCIPFGHERAGQRQIFACALPGYGALHGHQEVQIVLLEGAGAQQDDAFVPAWYAADGEWSVHVNLCQTRTLARP